MKPKVTKPKNLKLKEIVEIADRAYPEGLVAQYSRNLDGNFGDGLAKFIANELDSVYDKDVPEVEQLCQAARAMEKAASELAKVANAFRAELYEPLEKLEEDRQAAADNAWESAKLSAKLPDIKASNGWTIDGVFWSRKAFSSGDSIIGSFGVTFGVTFEADSAKIIDQWYR